MQCRDSSGLVNSAQHFPTSYEGTHACTHAMLVAFPRTHGTNACLMTHHFYLLGTQQRTSPRQR